MTTTALVIFAGALLVAAASPGPGILALVARVLSVGFANAVPFAIGLAIGDLVWLAAAVLGLAVLAHTLYGAFVAIKFAGAAYLLYFVFCLWFVFVVVVLFVAAPQRRGGLFFAGLSVTLGNPKVVAFYVALLPSLIDLTHVGIVGYLELAALCLAVLTVVLGGYALAAARARALFRSRRAIRVFNRTGSALMAVAAVAVATK